MAIWLKSYCQCTNASLTVCQVYLSMSANLNLLYTVFKILLAVCCISYHALNFCRNSVIRMQRQKACQKDIENFLAAQEKWKLRQKLQQEEENKRIKAFVEMQTQRECQLQQESQRKWETQAQINDYLSRKLYDEHVSAPIVELTLTIYFFECEC